MIDQTAEFYSVEKETLLLSLRHNTPTTKRPSDFTIKGFDETPSEEGPKSMSHNLVTRKLVKTGGGWVRRVSSKIIFI